ncbi:hypothetical protein PHET_00113 [Paragonimus heterotremus]|uniref:Vitellogenin domain-containing protein n=1 Tax=Paragonimus heterotremus TaxID=100268 RepID=A0A8J4TFG6_9TREM|nr:hypothetical protein PHET_00113 [Paragonimus heterotremus]
MWTILLIVIFCSVPLSKQADVINSGEERIIDLDSHKTYEFEFFVKLKVTPQSNSNDSHVHDELRGLMEITRDVGCLTTIVLRHVTGSTLVTQRNNTKYMKAREDDIRSHFEKPIEFCYNNGRVTQVKMHNLDSTWSLNLKRALISQMQISTESLELLFYTTESDVSGECLTEYIPVKSESGIVTLVKRKYAAGCGSKVKLESVLSAYEVQPPTHSSKLSFLDGTSSCEVQIASNKTILQSDCEETLSIRSMTLQSEQWRTVVQTTTQLKLVGITESRNSKLDDANAVPTSLKFEYSDVFKDRETKPIGELQTMFRKIYSSEQNVHTEEFYKLIKQLRTLNKDQLNRLVISLLETNHREMRPHVVDILMAAGTEATLEFMFDNSETLGMKPRDKLKALRAVKNPSLKVMHILKRAMEENFHSEIPLTISSMVNRICKQHQNCKNEASVQRIFEMLMQYIPTNCEHHTHKQLKTIVTNFHAAGNLGLYADVDNLTNVIRSCFNNPRVDISVKVAAIESLRRIGCNSLVNEMLWNYLSEQNEDSEVRINAYRSYMYCPTAAKIKNSIRLLKNERSQQVGSYIYSYLKESLAAGSSNHPLKSVGQPFEQEILEAGKAFSLSSLSYSKHYARSLNIGKGLVFLEASIIFCPESPIPRSIAMNISLAVFGQMLNLIEVSIRTTEQRQIVKYIRHLFQRLTTEISIEAVQPDEFDSQDPNFALFILVSL